ncbi:MAG: hypothetical protein JSU85_01940 [Candidatus Zixiibacteriota bacterium]|nr:MAG: hypothetical protein JSU85_01940 [candidate division Zixibacteria bacterium]
MRKLVITFLLTTALAVMHVLSYAEQSDTKEKTSGTVKVKNNEVGDSLLIDDLRILPKIKSLRRLLKEEQVKSNKWEVSLTANFSGDEAGGQNTSELKTSVEITKGRYPRQLRFKEKSDIRLEDDKLEEDVTTLLLNYDYYIKPSVEVYAFLERFKDSYMGIKHRFEIGFGALYEFTLLGLVNREEKENMGAIRELFGQLSERQRDSLRQDKETALTSIEKRDSRLEISFALTFFQELEQPEEIVAKVGTIDTTCSLAPEARFRIVIRPFIKYQVTKELSLSGFCYLKAPAFHPQKVDNQCDYRIDAQFLAKLKLSNDKQGNDKVNITFGYDLRYDNAPPSVELNGERFAANDFHGTTTLGITVEI